jgi:pimeloyl-ACP methyl ester carboxylesterase
VEEITVAVRDGMFTTHLLKGGAGRPLVFLHPVNGPRPGTPWLEALTQRYTVYAPWHPGWGQSEGLEHIDDVHDLATYYYDLFDALGLERPAVLGHSFGGMVAAELAAHCAGAVGSLVLVAPIGLWRDDAPVADIFTMNPRELVEAAVADPEGEIARRLAVMPEDPQQVADLMVERAQSMAAAGKFMWPIPDKGLKKRIHRIKAPTLIIWGTQDRLVPPVYAEEFHTRIPGSKVVLIEGAGHLVPVEKPDDFLRAVTEFLG